MTTLSLRFFPKLNGKRRLLSKMRGLLSGLRVVELAGLAPVPHCGLLLADAGAHVTVVEREEGETVEQRLNRGKESVRVDLKSAEGLNRVKELCSKADVLLDPFRPGVLEKMGLDPVQLLEQNKGLVVCRLTGYGQTGPLAMEAGHDINYVSLTGLMPVLAGQGGGRPWPPANLLADFAGGGLTAAFGIVTALLNRERNGGQGCIIDCSMVEGLSYLGSFVRQYYDMSHLWTDKHCAFGGECPIYRTYETKDGQFMAVGALEPKFTANLFKVLELDISISEVYSDPVGVTQKMEKRFKTKTRDEWAALFAGKDACVTPVLQLDEAPSLPHHSQRSAFVRESDRWQASAAPRFFSAEEFRHLRHKL